MGYYCASAYDGVFLLADILKQCGDRDTECLRDALYATQNWEGRFFGTLSFDENGEITAEFRINQISGGVSSPVN